MLDKRNLKRLPQINSLPKYIGGSNVSVNKYPIRINIFNTSSYDINYIINEDNTHIDNAYISSSQINNQLLTGTVSSGITSSGSLNFTGPNQYLYVTTPGTTCYMYDPAIINDAVQNQIKSIGYFLESNSNTVIESVINKTILNNDPFP